jgi:uncharacterized protein YdiU (UPF0061 family)
VIARQARLIARWMQLGFIHGVMNTDNCSIAGETIDYGPCAFMDRFEPGKVFSSIDQTGRYAWGNQGRIGHWNVAQLAQALLPAIDSDEDKAISAAQSAVDRFPQLFQAAHVGGFAQKLGLSEDVAPAFIDETLEMLAAVGVDYTLFWRTLTDSPDDVPSILETPEFFADWANKWQAMSPDREVMKQANPVAIPRNHMIQNLISAGETGDFSLFHNMNVALQRPFDAASVPAAYTAAPEVGQEVQRTFCGT